MSDVYRFVVLGRPQQRGSKVARALYNRKGELVMKNGRPILSAQDANKNSKSWMQEIRAVAGNGFSGDLLKGPIEVKFVFYFRRPKSHFGTGKNANTLKKTAPPIHAQSPDLAKLIRAAEDALTGQVWLDDKQVFRYRDCERRWTAQQERMEVEIREIHDCERLSPSDGQGCQRGDRDQRTHNPQVD